MSNQEPRPIRKILVATGLTIESVAAVLMAKRLAEKIGAELHAVHAIEPISGSQEQAVPGLSEKHETHACEELDTFVKSHGLEGCATLHVVKGVPERQILKLRAQIKADLLIMGRYGKGGLKRGALGSIANQLVRKSPVSTLIVQPEFRGDFGSLGVASDLDADSYLEVTRGITLARTLGFSTVHLITAYTIPAGFHTVMEFDEACEKLAQITKERGQKLVDSLEHEGVEVVVHTVKGTAPQAVPVKAGEIGVDLLVLSTHERSRTATLLLSRTTEKIINNTHCSVWAEKAPELHQGLLEAVKELLD